MLDIDLLAQVRSEKPLVHCITNYVTANDVANFVLAAGASPVMADEVKEVGEIASRAKALVLNLGTLRESTVESMLRAGEKTAALGHPIILDPVGCGASAFRLAAARQLIKAFPCTVIRGNASEIRSLAGLSSTAKGVDVGETEVLSNDNLSAAKVFVRRFSRETGAVIIMTGAVDLVADESRTCLVRNGHAMMTQITGTGCMMDGVLGAFQAVVPPVGMAPGSAGVFWKSVYAVAAAGLCGEMAYEKTVRVTGGTGSFRRYYIDAMSLMTDERIRGGANIEI